MWRIIIYLFPVLINMLLGGMFYICAYRLAGENFEHGKLIATCTTATWSILYCLCTQIMGRIATPKRAPAMLTASGCLLAVSSLGCVVFPAPLVQFVWLALVGIGIAGYCTPFQVLAKDLETTSSGGVSRTVAGYNISWSLGMATGPSLFGILGENWQLGYYANAVMSLMMVAGVLYIVWMKRTGRLKGSADLTAEETHVEEYAGRPNLVWVGWICIGLGSIYIAALRAIEPVFAENTGLGSAHGGLILATVSYTQVIGSILLLRSKKWMYNSLPLILTSVFGVAGMLLFAFILNAGVLYLASFLIGIYSTAFYFMGVFHSQVDPVNSVKYVACNETLVGICGVIGSIGSGLLGDACGFRVTFICMAALAVVSLALQLAVRARIMKRVAK